MNRGITKENLLRIVPPALTHDPAMMARAAAEAQALSRRPDEIDRLVLYPRVDRLPEKLLDILAYDFKIDWWDPGYSLEEKRRTFKSNWYVHKHMGTRAAVETAIRAIYPLTTVEEWFEYGGEPYHFRLYLDLSGIKGDDIHPRRVVERVNFYKNLRSHLDRIEFLTRPRKSAALRIGGCMSAHIRVPLPELADGFRFRNTIRVGSAGAAMVRAGIPEDRTPPPLAGKVRTGGQPVVRFTMPVPELE